MANDPLEGFHEVNLASPTSPDLLAVYEPGTQEQTTSPSVISRPHPSALCSTPIQANDLDVSDLPTQPVYSSPRRLNCAEISSGRQERIKMLVLEHCIKQMNFAWLTYFKFYYFRKFE